MSGGDDGPTGPSEAEVGWSVYRGHGHYLCAGCGRPVPESSTEPVYVLDERSGFRARRVEPDCFKRAREEAWPSPIPADHLGAASPLPAKKTPSRHTSTTDTRCRGQTTEDQVAILRSAGRFPSDATAEEIAFGLEVARLIGLDPWLGQVMFLRFDPADKIHPFVGIDGMRAVAERSGQYRRSGDRRRAREGARRSRETRQGHLPSAPEGLEPSAGGGGLVRGSGPEAQGRPTHEAVGRDAYHDAPEGSGGASAPGSLPAPALRGLRRAGSSDGVERVSAAIRSPTEPRSIGQPGVLTGVLTGHDDTIPMTRP